jgi:hypothetical protein
LRRRARWRRRAAAAAQRPCCTPIALLRGARLVQLAPLRELAT